MKKLLASLLVTAAVTPAFAWDQTAMNRQIDNTSVVLNHSCSGTLIAPDKVLTANHCIGDNYTDRTVEQVDPATGEVKHVTVRVKVPGTVTKIKFVDGVETERTVIRYDVVKAEGAMDLALISLARPFTTLPAPVACHAPTRGDTVWSVGNPGVVLYANLAKGIVSSTDRSYSLVGIDDSNDHRFIQHTALIAPGSSGGALYNDAGQIVGVNVRGNVVFWFAVYTDDLNKFLAGTGLECK